ncbi:MAG TPA: lanthionine synthetase LanC family protein [Ktedonosporobacter sp.]|nr:lanthionine synthetase LanC family protein [Ktedonosporobacter sp.]
MSMEHDPIVRLVSDLRHTASHRCTISLVDGWWVFHPLHSSEYPRQGWKLHISAIPLHASHVLQAVANVLIEQAVHWKVCQNLKRLVELLSVPSSYVQVGKFITIYPRTEQQALELAARLHSLTAAYSGPIIPTDKRYAPGSQVYYRYGGFARIEFYHPDTLLRTPCILTPTGEKVHDKREPGRYCPDWVVNPFPCEDRQPTPDARKGLFGKGLTVASTLRRSAKGGVYVVNTALGTAILKEARLGTNPDLAGRDARDRLSNEFEILCKLAPSGIAPQPLELFDADQNRYLLMERLAGQSLASYIEQCCYLGDDDQEHLRTICTALIDLVQTCHAAGVIIRDFTPNNVLVSQHGCKLVDLELASTPETGHAPFIGYTPGYVAPGTELLARQTVADDLYALGATLCFTLTGVPPHLLLTQEQRGTLEETLLPFLRDIRLYDLLILAIRYLRPERTEHASSPAISFPAASPVQPPASTELAFDGEALKANAGAVARDLHQGAEWQSTDRLWTQSKLGGLFHPACFHTGTAGIAYYLCEVAQATHDVSYYEYAADVLEWTLSTHPFIPEESPAGLYFGYAAIPWVLALLADGLNDMHYADRALHLADQISRAPLRQLDITHGAAGRGLMHLEMYRRFGDQEQLAHAIDLAEQIVAQREEHATGAISWVNQGKRMWGFAHGAAGLAYYLLRLLGYIENTRYRSIAEKTARSLMQAAIPTVRGQGLTWPMGPTELKTRWTHWCNGASGVGLYFLEAARKLQQPEFRHMALQAANTIRLGHAFGSCCQCHGLAGEGDYLLQVSREFAGSEMEQGAWKIANKLFALRFVQRPWWLWPEETRGQPAPDYMTGYCGVYSFLLRLFCQDIERPFFQHQTRADLEPITAMKKGETHYGNR